MRPPYDAPDSRALSALSELARDAAEPPSSAELGAGLDALRARVAGETPRRGRTARWALLGVAAMLVVGIGVAVVSFRKAPTPPASAVLVTRIEGGKLLDAGYLSESGQGGVRVRFNEGSEFALAPGARGRLRSVTAEGAQLELQRGTASFHVTPSPGHRWSVEAGPFVVTVTGTEFSVRWDPASEEFELRLRRGRVMVSGPVTGDGLVLRPGQTLRVSLPKAETRITEEPEDRASSAPPPTTAAAPAPRAPAAPANASTEPSGARPAPNPAPAAGSATARRWREAMAKGEWDRILQEVERDGVEASLEVLSSDELFVLTDAARYRRRPELARAALLAERRRFPRSPRSVDALFLLGRVEELGKGGSAEAIKWYDEYLSRAAGGTYAAEALGRKMILLNQSGGHAEARSTADEYLRRFPQGSYAEAARTLLRLP